MAEKKRIAAIDLFCGIGGLTKGLELSGIDVVAGIDIDSTCEFTYTRNTKSRFVCRNVETLDVRELHNYYPSDTGIRVLVGCAPCQPFSRLSGKYRMDGYMDDKWKLLYSFSSIITKEKPDIVSMENVPDLEKNDVLHEFVNSLKQLDYNVSYGVVFCPDYGVPQNRRRLVLLASRLGEIRLIKPTRKKDDYMTVRDAIGCLTSIKAGESDTKDPMHRACALSKKNLKRIQQSKPGGTWKDWNSDLLLECHKKDSGKTYPSVYGRMEWDKPSPTITTQFFGYGNGRFGHPEQDRAISLREGAILQSFPLDYVFSDEKHPIILHDVATHIGNAVPVELGKAIGESILNHIKMTLGEA